MDLEKLLILVKQNECLYNFNHKNYHDTPKKEALWQAIGKKLNSSAKDCKRQWTTLRDGLRRTLRKRKLSGEGQALNPKKWKYEEEMSFIFPYLKEKPPSHYQTMLLLSSDEEEEENVAGDTEDVKTSTSQTEGDKKLGPDSFESSLSGEVIKYLIDHKKDEIETMFYSLAQTVKKMSPYYQALAKSKVCTAVSELELQYLTLKHNEESLGAVLSQASAPSHVLTQEEIQITSELHEDEIIDIKPFSN